MKVLQASLLVLAAVLGAACAQDDWSDADLAALKEDIYAWMEENEQHSPESLRFAFHSCTGGCDGCINMADPDNGGLETVFDQLNDLYDRTFPFGEEGLSMSRADFWALVGVVAVEYAIDLNNEDCQGAETCAMPNPNFQYVYGRTDCPTSPDLPSDTIVGLPGGFLDYAGVMSFFSDEFGLDENEATALLGAHTIGRMSRSGSGYTGAWKEQAEFFFNAQYYSNMVSRILTWEQFNAEDDPSMPEKWQWRGLAQDGETEQSFMLPADISLVQLLEIEDDGGHSSCEFLECDYAPSTNLVEFFSNNQDVWLDLYVVAYDKMVANVGDEVRANLRRPRKS